MRNSSLRCLAVATLLLGVAGSLPGQSKEAKDSPKKEAQKAEAAPATPIAVDDLFIETYENYTWVLREIDRIEKSSGTIEVAVSIKDLRARAEEKLGRLRSWMQEHKVPSDWSYDQVGRKFIPPPQPAAKPEAAKP